MNNRQNQTLPRIAKIIAVEPFKITALWTNEEVRQLDFEPLFAQWKREVHTLLYPLFTYETFSQAAVSSARTLHWPSVSVQITLRNRTIEAPLDLDPDELYRQSTLLRKAESLGVGNILRKARLEAGLSQIEVAIKSGTSRNYISRIENGRSDIQLETLNKIVQLGIGKQIRLEIA